MNGMLVADFMEDTATLQAGRASTAETLQQHARAHTGGRGWAFRDGLVVLQVAATLALLVAAGLMLRTMANLNAVPVGFDAHNLLTMQSGLESTSGGNYGQWVRSRNWVRHALARPMVSDPGTSMEYSTGTSHILSAILTKASGRSTHQFAADVLARPLGIKGFPPWWHPEMGWLVGLSVPGHLGSNAGRVHYPFTANLWARTAVCRAEPFQELGGKLGGEEGSRYITGREDAEWWRRLRVKGYRTRFDSALVVRHAIDTARLDLKYLRQRAEMDPGRSQLRRTQSSLRAGLRPFGRPFSS